MTSELLQNLNGEAAADADQPAAFQGRLAIEDYPSSVHLHPPAILLTRRLSIRCATELDIPVIHSFLCNEEVMKYMGTTTSTSLDDSVAWCNKRFGTDPVTGEQRGEFFRLISLRNQEDDDQVIGFIGMRCAPYIAYQIGAGPNFWGQGYASEAVAAVLQGISKTLRQEHPSYPHTAYVAIEVESENIGSARVAQKVGAVKVGQRIEEKTGKVIKEFRYYVGGQDEA